MPWLTISLSIGDSPDASCAQATGNTRIPTASRAANATASLKPRLITTSRCRRTAFTFSIALEHESRTVNQFKSDRACGRHDAVPWRRLASPSGLTPCFMTRRTVVRPDDPVSRTKISADDPHPLRDIDHLLCRHRAPARRLPDDLPAETGGPARERDLRRDHRRHAAALGDSTGRGTGAISAGSPTSCRETWVSPWIT